MKTFTQDWFTHNIDGIKSCIRLVPKIERVLEIGSFEGRSACYWLGSVLQDDGRLDCIDNFGGSLEHSNFDFIQVKERFKQNVELSKKPTQTVYLHEKSSVDGLATLIIDKARFDVIYVDGSHTSTDTLTDAVMAWQLLKVGGIMIFDDYLWEAYTAPFNNPKWGIDTFVTMFCRQLQIIMHGYQVAIIKVSA